jgi:hypothetical protein
MDIFCALERPALIMVKARGDLVRTGLDFGDDALDFALDVVGQGDGGTALTRYKAE